MGPLSFSSMRMSVFPVPFIEEIVLSLLCILDHIFMGLFLGWLFCFGLCLFYVSNILF